MEAESTVNASSIAELLEQTYSGENTAIQKQAQGKLEQLTNSPLFVQSLQYIIHDQSLNENIRSAAAVYLSKECKSLSAKGQDPTRVLLVVIQLLESGVDISLKRHIGNALKHLIFKDSHKPIRLELYNQLVEKLKVLIVTADFKEYEYESCTFVAAALVQTTGESIEEKQVLFVLVSAIYELILKTMAYVQQSLTDIQLEIISLRRLMLMRELCRLILSIVKLVNIQDTPQFVAFFCVPSLDALLAGILQLKTNETITLFAHGVDKKSPILNELKHHIVHSLDFMIRKINKLSSSLPNCTTYNNIPKYTQFLMSQILLSLKDKKYYEMQNRAVNLLQVCMKFLRTCLKLPHMDSFFNKCRKQLLFDIIIPLLEFNPDQTDNYNNQPEEFISYIFGIADRKESEENQDDEWQMQITVASVLTIFCQSQHGTLNEIFEFVMARLPSSSAAESNILLIVIAILRDSTKERPDIHQLLKNYLDIQIPTLLQNLSNTSQKMIRALKLYIIHKYNLFISYIDQNFVAVVAKLALFIIQTGQLRDDHVLQIIALDILANICDIGDDVMSNTAEQIFIALIPLIQQPVNHRLYDTMQEIIKGYSEKLSDEAIAQCVHELVCKIQFETINKQPPVISNKCWNVIREIGESDYFIPRLIAPIENEVLKLQKYLQKPEEVDFEEDFLLLCTSFIKKCKKITANQLSLFECFSKIFQRYSYTFGHMFETMSYFIFYGIDILKQSPKAVDYVVQICIKSVMLPKSLRSNEADQSQGALLLQSLIICSSEAFTQSSLQNVIEVLRQRMQTPIQYDFLKANLLCALGLALIKVWKVINREQAELLLTMLLTDTSCCNNEQHPARLMVLIISQLMAIDDPITQAKLGLMLRCIINIASNSILKTNNSKEAILEVTTEMMQYDMEIKSYKSPIQHLNEYQLFRSKFQQIRKQYPQKIASAMSQLTEKQQNLLKNIIKMEKVGNEGRLKLTVKRPVN